MQESQTSEVKLPDDDPIAVQMMVEYLYFHYYMPPLPSTRALTAKAKLSPTVCSAKRKKDSEECGTSIVVNKRMKELDGRPSNNNSSPGATIPTTPLSSASVHPTRQSLFSLGTQPAASPAPVHSASQSLFSSVTNPTQLSVFGSPSVQQTPNPPPSSPQPSGSDQAPPANLSLHAKVYALGEKYGIEHLKLFAIQKFEAEVESHLQSKDFLMAIEEAYTSTVEEDRGLRDVVVKTMKKHKYLLKKLSVQAIVKSTQLGFDLLMNFASVPEK
jgi:hypothetical protein